MDIKTYNLTNGVIYQGNVLDVLKSMAPESCQMVCTSPPYLGLRSYGTPPVIWDDPGNCLGHVWQSYSLVMNKSGGPSKKQESNVGAWNPDGIESDSSTCTLCGAIRCSLGMEPTAEMFVDHLVQIFREVRKVLHPSGCVFLNMGSSYAGSGGAHSIEHQNPGISKSAERDGYQRHGHIGDNYKAKDLIPVPWLCAISLQKDGWFLRSGIPWVKANPMPSSVLDHPASALEYVFLLTKSKNYFWDMQAIRMKQTGTAHSKGKKLAPPIDNAGIGHKEWHKYTPQTDMGDRGRNFRDTDLFYQSIKPPHGLICVGDELVGLDVNPQPTSYKHYASFPEKLVEPLVKAGASLRGCCPECLEPWTRVIEKTITPHPNRWSKKPDAPGNYEIDVGHYQNKGSSDSLGMALNTKTIGWIPGCDHYDHLYRLFPRAKRQRKRDQRDISGDWWTRARKRPGLKEWETVSCNVTDIFGGSMTVAVVAQRYGHRYTMIELSEEYIKTIGIPRIKAAERGQRFTGKKIKTHPAQQSLF